MRNIDDILYVFLALLAFGVLEYLAPSEGALHVVDTLAGAFVALATSKIHGAITAKRAEGLRVEAGTEAK